VATAHQLSRAVREPGWQPEDGDEEPKPWMVVPTTCGRAAVRVLHNEGPSEAKSYLAKSKVGQWTGHSFKPLASNATAVVNGFEWYASQDAADGRATSALDKKTLVDLPDGQVEVRLDVVLADGDDLAARAVLWDAPTMTEDAGPVMACVFAHALEALYPGRSFTTVGVWQARRQQLVEVPFDAAMAQTSAASAILASM
jgi:hypothetical protein